MTTIQFNLISFFFFKFKNGMKWGVLFFSKHAHPFVVKDIEHVDEQKHEEGPHHCPCLGDGPAPEQGPVAPPFTQENSHHGLDIGKGEHETHPTQHLQSQTDVSEGIEVSTVFL